MNKGLIIGVVVFCILAFLSLAGASVYTVVVVSEDEEFQKAMDEIENGEYGYDSESDDISEEEFAEGIKNLNDKESVEKLNNSGVISDEIAEFIKNYNEGSYSEDEAFKEFNELYQDNLVFYEEFITVFAEKDDNPDKKIGSVLQKYKDELFDEEEKMKDKEIYDEKIYNLQVDLNKFSERNTLLLETYGEDLIDYLIEKEYHSDRDTISQIIYYSIIPFENAAYELPMLFKQTSEIHFNTFDDVSLDEREELNYKINDYFSSMGNNYQTMLSLNKTFSEYYY